MTFLNKKAVEALPLKYIIIALVAALVIGIALQFVGVLKGGTIGAANQMNQSLTTKTACELDQTGPVVNTGTLCNTTGTCGTIVNRTAGGMMYVNANVTDNQGGCGIDDYSGVFAYVYQNGADLNQSISLRRTTGDSFTGTYTPTTTGTYNVRIYAKDNSTSQNVQRLWNQTANVTVI